jgi:5-dehydro-4-deoxyglucarate dehydratase
MDNSVRNKGMDWSEMTARVGGGLLSFPVTHFASDGQFDEARYRDHCSWLLQYEIAALFVAGGTGEFFSLRPDEVEAVVRAAVQEVAGRLPVIAGCGYGTAMAVELAQTAERAGANGILLFPPYLVTGDQKGMIAHIETVCRSTSLGVITYNRDNATLDDRTLEELCERCPNLVGFKDGVGDIELMTRIRARMGDRLIYIGGLPTAETYALPYMEMGVTTYSSAIFNFMPQWALHFYQLVRARDRESVMQQLENFVLPYVAIRNRGKGYAVSIVKAALDAIGRPAGPVRPPLTDLLPHERAELKALIESQRTLVGHPVT